MLLSHWQEILPALMKYLSTFEQQALALYIDRIELGIGKVYLERYGFESLPQFQLCLQSAQNKALDFFSTFDLYSIKDLELEEQKKVMTHEGKMIEKHKAPTAVAIANRPKRVFKPKPTIEPEPPKKPKKQKVEKLLLPKRTKKARKTTV